MTDQELIETVKDWVRYDALVESVNVKVDNLGKKSFIFNLYKDVDIDMDDVEWDEYDVNRYIGYVPDDVAEYAMEDMEEDLNNICEEFLVEFGGLYEIHFTQVEWEDNSDGLEKKVYPGDYWTPGDAVINGYAQIKTYTVLTISEK